MDFCSTGRELEIIEKVTNVCQHWDFRQKNLKIPLAILTLELITGSTKAAYQQVDKLDSNFCVSHLFSNITPI